MTIIEIIKTNKAPQKWYWRIKAGNGKILASSEKYYRRGKMERTITNIIKDIQFKEVRVVEK